MRLLVDSHAFLWFVWQDARLGAAASGLIADPNNQPLLSQASYWEIAIKIGVKRLTLGEPFDVFITREIQQHGIRILPIEIVHANVLTTLPQHHRDPFDRMLVAQAMIEKVPIVSNDSQLDKYPITRLW